jgi:hemoglobin-like flavoprotein
MTPEKVKLVQDSFEKVVPIASTAADIFYDRLFEVAPEVRPMFAADMTKQKEQLMATLATAVKSLDNTDAIVPVLQKLGRDHVGYGVKDEHYDTVGGALLFTLEKGLGEDWNDELKDAWGETYGLVASVMKEAAAEIPQKKPGILTRLFGT